MHTYTAQTFNLPELKGLSAKQLEVHLKLYEGYVKNTNLLASVLDAYEKTEDEGGKYALMEVRRRLGFEFDGMRMHELYFEQMEKGAQPISGESALSAMITEKFGGFETFWNKFKSVGMTRGIGWAVLYYDNKVGAPHLAWVGDHEFGQLANIPVILAMDMWEHAFMVDYTPAEKAKYIDAFASNLNWSVMKKRFEKAKK